MDDPWARVSADIERGIDRTLITVGAVALACFAAICDVLLHRHHQQQGKG